MSRRYPYPRWIEFQLTPLEQLHCTLLRPYWKLKGWLHGLWYSEPVWRRIGRPLRDWKHSPWVAFSPETNAPVITDAMIACRTRHGAATLHWSCGCNRAPLPERACKVLLPDGTRGDVESRTTWWRRKSRDKDRPDRLWIIGDVEIRPDEVAFTDAAVQDLPYQPPTADSCFQLERQLALHPPFVAALADDKFAAVAHNMLAQLEWVRIGAHEIGLFDAVHHMIAALRNKGEDDFDFKFGGYPAVRLTDVETAAHARRLQEIMRSLGWRTYTGDELKARMREDFDRRVERRLEAWRAMDEYEARPAGSHEVIAKAPLVMEMPLREGDDAAWLEELRGEERAAVSEKFVERLIALAASGRITEGEYRDIWERIIG
jgi:hypothetical protein